MTAAPIALTMGDPAGVGGEITLKAWLRRNQGLPPFFVIDDHARLERLAAALDISVPLHKITTPAEAIDVFPSALPVLHRPLAVQPVGGKPDAANGKMVLESIKEAVSFALSKEACAVVTNPIHKQGLYEAGFQFPGHTEFLAELSVIKTPPVMMLAGPSLRVVPISVHVSLRDAIEALSAEVIIEKTLICARALVRDFAIESPRLAIAGLNPHAGEGGSLGNEEATIISPAIKTLQDQGLKTFGPVPPDTLFSHKVRQSYDAAICMYHDQALIPLKALDFDKGVNVTLGLPLVRTSPDHGTAFDIAGKGTASEDSLIEAIKMAAGMANRRDAT
jgi:4-hydroxythreonine-4-phosphate dehydrogenase